MSEGLTRAVRALLQSAETCVRSPEAAAVLAESRTRLSEPLRLALAGRVKAGKSTLLNALVGEELAPTDAGECTRVVSWYRGADRAQVLLHRRDGAVEARRFRRSGGALDIELGEAQVDEVDHLEIRWPSLRLSELTLIDTPGIASLSPETAGQAERALSDEDDRPAVADAVLYLLRHTHASDVRFLEAFHDDEIAHGTSLNAVGILSRADEVGSCRRDALEVAARIADRYQGDQRLRRLCPLVVPVAGLLASAAATLTEPEFRALATIAALPAADRDELLLTADRFAAGRSSLPLVELQLRHLLQQFGLFGVRLSVDLIASGVVRTASELADELLHRSGIQQLRGVLVTQFVERSRVLQARSALAALGTVLRSGGCVQADQLRARIEEIRSGAHAFVEVRLLAELRSGGLDLRDEERAEEMHRLLGGSGHDRTVRLGLPPDADTGAQLAAAQAALQRWQRLAEHPLYERTVRVAARATARTVEGLLSDLAAGGAPVVR